jgi:hypothetical protein
MANLVASNAINIFLCLTDYIYNLFYHCTSNTTTGCPYQKKNNNNNVGAFSDTYLKIFYRSFPLKKNSNLSQEMTGSP